MHFSENARLVEALRHVNPSSITPVIEHGINMEKVILETNTILGNESECMESKNKIADSKIFLLILSGDLPE